MNSQDEALEVLEVVPQIGAIEAQTRGEIDIQIATAKRFPRSITKAIKDATSLATLSEEVAEQCIYALPRKERGVSKMIEGPSVRLAEIVASCWGHMRIEARVVDEDERFVTSRGTAWDLEKNTAIAYESKRRITDRHGKRYQDDMIMTTSNAASAVALRNAVLRVVPKAFWAPIYAEARKAAVGNAETLANRRSKMLAYFAKLGVSDDRIFAALSLKGLDDIGLDELAALKGIANAIKEGDTTIEQAFPPIIKEPQRVQPEAEAQGATTSVDAAGASSAASSSAAPAASAEPPADRPSTTSPAGGDTPASGGPPAQAPASSPQKGTWERGALLKSVKLISAPDGKERTWEIVTTRGSYRTKNDQIRTAAEVVAETDRRVSLRWEPARGRSGERLRNVLELVVQEPPPTEQGELLEGDGP